MAAIANEIINPGRASQRGLVEAIAGFLYVGGAGIRSAQRLGQDCRSWCFGYDAVEGSGICAQSVAR